MVANLVPLLFGQRAFAAMDFHLHQREGDSKLEHLCAAVGHFPYENKS